MRKESGKMKILNFYDQEHEKFFKEHNGEILDPYYRSLVYLLGLVKETREHYKSIYNEQKKEVNIEGLKESWQTGTSIIVCRLALNLFNGFTGLEETETKAYVVDSIFYNKEYAPYFWEAVRIRFSI